MNPMDMIKNLQGMQSRMQEMQSKLNDVTAEGESGGGMVKVVLTGQYSVLDVKIAKEAIDPDDPELIEDLVLSAFYGCLKQDQGKDSAGSRINCRRFKPSSGNDGLLTGGGPGESARQTHKNTLQASRHRFKERQACCSLPA